MGGMEEFKEHPRSPLASLKAHVPCKHTQALCQGRPHGPLLTNLGGSRELGVQRGRKHVMIRNPCRLVVVCPRQGFEAIAAEWGCSCLIAQHHSCVGAALSHSSIPVRLVAQS